MKCIKINNELKKVQDKVAVDLVFDKKAVFVSKSDYKAVHGKGKASTLPTQSSSNQRKKAKNKKIDLN